MLDSVLSMFNVLYNSLKLHKIQYYYFHFKDKYPEIQETMNDTRATENKGQCLPKAYITSLSFPVDQFYPFTWPSNLPKTWPY